MHNHIEISSSALKHNVAMLQQITGKSQLVPVLKSNAYGHGLLETYLCLKNSQLSWICVNDINEAEILRNAGFKKNLLVCGPVIRSDTQRATSLKLDIFVGSYETLYEILHSKNTRLRIHLEFDTGMSRLGFPPESIDNIKQDIASLNIVGACMHFSNVEDVSNQSYALLQLQKFEAVRKSLRKLFPKCLFHAAASAPALILKQSRFDLCRAGIAVYGLWPSALTKLSFFQSANKLLELKPALTWKSEITQLTPVAAGQFVGYGCTFKAAHKMTIGVIPVGYFEGFPRAAGKSQAYVLIAGRRCAIIGRVCMNMMMVDVSEISSAKVGDTVTLIGNDGKENLSVEDIASWCDSINYEVVSRINGIIPRVIVK